jgi:hypothetical protein
MNLESFGAYDPKDRLRTNFCCTQSWSLARLHTILKEKEDKLKIRNFLSYIWHQESHSDQEKLNIILMVLV